MQQKNSKNKPGKYFFISLVLILVCLYFITRVIAEDPPVAKPEDAKIDEITKMLDNKDTLLDDLAKKIDSFKTEDFQKLYVKVKDKPEQIDKVIKAIDQKGDRTKLNEFASTILHSTTKNNNLKVSGLDKTAKGSLEFNGNKIKFQDITKNNHIIPTEKLPEGIQHIQFNDKGNIKEIAGDKGTVVYDYGKDGGIASLQQGYLEKGEGDKSSILNSNEGKLLGTVSLSGKDSSFLYGTPSPVEKVGDKPGATFKEGFYVWSKDSGKGLYDSASFTTEDKVKVIASKDDIYVRDSPGVKAGFIAETTTNEKDLKTFDARGVVTNEKGFSADIINQNDARVLFLDKFDLTPEQQKSLSNFKNILVMGEGSKDGKPVIGAQLIGEIRNIQLTNTKDPSALLVITKDLTTHFPSNNKPINVIFGKVVDERKEPQVSVESTNSDNPNQGTQRIGESTYVRENGQIGNSDKTRGETFQMTIGGKSVPVKILNQEGNKITVQAPDGSRYYNACITCPNSHWQKITQ